MRAGLVVLQRVPVVPGLRPEAEAGVSPGVYLLRAATAAAVEPSATPRDTTKQVR